MATIQLYRKKETNAIYIVLRHRNTSSHISLNMTIPEEQWDSESKKIVKHPQKAIMNNIIARKMLEVEGAILEFDRQGKRFSGAAELKNAVVAYLTPADSVVDNSLFMARFERFANSRPAEGTRRVYRGTMSRLRAYSNRIDAMHFEDIDRVWLSEFERYLSKTSPSANARNIHLRNIRAVFNDAIDDGVTTHYPFRRFKIKPQPTRKRSLSVEALREIIHMPVEPHVCKYRDTFVLVFYLIGINMVDLCSARKEDLRDGRLEYVRAKTGKHYSVRVWPEAQELIDMYAGVGDTLINIMDSRTNYTAYCHRCNDALKNIGGLEVRKHGKKVYEPICADLTLYWARHTWATIAAELDIPKDVIALALGHGGNSVTDIYIRYDLRKVDEANRRVIDYVLYNIR